MKPFGSVVLSIMFGLAALPALAQQSTDSGGPPPGYGYGHMWGWGGGWNGGFWIFHPFLVLLALVGLVVLIRRFVYGPGYYGYRGWRHWHRMPGGPDYYDDHGGALAVLEERFAKGEIGKEEFEEKRKLIRG